MKMRLILPISEVLQGDQVRKPTGDKLYTVRDEIIIWEEGRSDPTRITTKDGRFMMDSSGGVMAVPNTHKVAVVGTAAQLLELLRRMEQRAEDAHSK